MTKKKPGAKMGRPPLPKSKRRSIEVNVRMTPTENRRIKAEAVRTGRTVSEVLMAPWRDVEGE